MTFITLYSLYKLKSTISHPLLLNLLMIDIFLELCIFKNEEIESWELFSILFHIALSDLKASILLFICFDKMLEFSNGKWFEYWFPNCPFVSTKIFSPFIDALSISLCSKELWNESFDFNSFGSMLLSLKF